MTEAPAPGWYADPENPATRRYWDGRTWLAPVPPSSATTEGAATLLGPPAQRPRPGYFKDAADPTRRRYWNGKRLTQGTLPLDPNQPEPPDLPAGAMEASAAAANRQFLWANYIIGALVPIWGWIAAIYIAVSEKRRSIRRHAIGSAAIALTAAGIYTLVIISVHNSQRDSSVASDLQSLLSSHGVSASDISCAHQSGNLYQCSATVNGQQQFATVTDDGSTIYEVGISSSGG